MRLKSYTVSRIAASLAISTATVKRELRDLQAEWRANAAESIEIHRERELQRLELIEREAFAEWERSKKDYSKEVTERLKMPGKGEDTEGFETEAKVVKRETGGRLGDPRLLEIVIRAQDARRKLLGLDAPTKVAPTTPDGTKPYQPEKMSDTELDARIEELIAKSARAA
jgi:hypothetical protein